jgi:hypothetical protein
MEPVTFKLECPDKSLHRFRSGDPYETWKWCAAVAERYKHLDCVIELGSTGHVAEAALDFSRLFEELRKETLLFGDDSAVRLRLVPRRSLSFRLMRDVSSHSFRLSGRDRVLTEVGQAIAQSQMTDVEDQRRKDQLAAAVVHVDDIYTPEFSKANSYVPRKDVPEVAAPPLKFTLARDTDPSFARVRLYTDMT